MCNREKNSFTFTREQTTLLIEIYQQYALLYEVGDENYKNKTKRIMAIQAIQKNFNEKFAFTNITGDDVRKKINSLRTQVFAELNKIKKSMVSGAGSDDLYQPSLWCFQHLMFLDSTNPIRQGESSLNLEELNSADSVLDEDGEILFEGSVDKFNSQNTASPIETQVCSKNRASPIQAQYHTPSISAKKRKLGADKAISVMEKASVALDRMVSDEKEYDVIDAFLIHLRADLRQIKSASRCREVRKKIIDLVLAALEDE